MKKVNLDHSIEGLEASVSIRLGAPHGGKPRPLKADRRRKKRVEGAVAVSKEVRLEEIYRAAAEIIHREGFDSTTLADIANAVGLTKAGLYHYIPSKGDLLYGIIVYGFEQADEAVIVPTRDITDPEERVRAIVQAYAHLVMENGLPLAITNAELQNVTPVRRRKLLAARRKAIYDYVRDAIQDVKREGVASVLDASITAFGVFAILVSLAQWYRPGGRLPADQVADQITELISERIIGLTPQKKAAASPD